MKNQLLRLQKLVTQGVISKSEYKQAMAERQGATVRQGGRLVKHGLASQAYKERKGVISKVRTVTGDQPEQANTGRGTPSLAGKMFRHLGRDPRVAERDMRIRYDRERVAMGCNSAMVKVVKGCGRRA